MSREREQYRADVVAALQGQLPPDRVRGLRAALEGSPDLAAFEADARKLLDQLEQLDEADWVITRRRRASRWPVVFAAAAALLVGVVLWWPELATGVSDAASLPVGASPLAQEVLDTADWLAASLDARGSWSPEAGGGNDGVGLHAFGVLALVRAGPLPAGSARRGSVLAAADWLVDQQADNGMLGLPVHTGSFDHPVATVALLEVAAATGEVRYRDAADRALRHLGQHHPTGVRGGRRAACEAWVLQALVRARDLGWSDLDEAVLASCSRVAAVHPDLACATVDLPGVRRVCRAGDGRGVHPVHRASLAVLAALDG